LTMANFVKFLMFVANFVFWAMGAALLGITIWMSVDDSAKSTATITGLAGMNSDVYWAAVYMLMALGCLVILAGFAGCLGAVKAPDSDRILHSYFGFVKFIILCEIVVLILIGVYWDAFDSSIKGKMTSQVQRNYTQDNGTDSVTKAWDNMQENWQCCGSDNITDYANSTYATRFPLNQVPKTCCRKESKVVLDCQNPFRLENANLRGCYDKLKNVVDDNSTLIIVITCVFVGLELFGSICACLLIRRK